MYTHYVYPLFQCFSTYSLILSEAIQSFCVVPIPLSLFTPYAITHQYTLYFYPSITINNIPVLNDMVYHLT